MENINKIIEKPKRNFYREVGEFLWDLGQTLIISFGLFIIIYNFLVQPNSVIGSSMEPNFYDGEYILTDRLSYRLDEPQRGDVVVFKYPKDETLEYIKRIIGLPGEKVLIENNTVTIFNEENPEGFLIDEKYLPEGTITEGSGIFQEGKETLIPTDSYFVMGDNRARSSDSRSWGTVSEEEITGKALFRYWPIDRFGVIKKVEY